MADCIFCRIIQGEIPCAKVYEDDFVLSFLDINPINTGHTLVVPKKHCATLFEISPEELQACMLAAQRLAKAVFNAVGATGLNLLQNNFRSAGQLIDHVHFHLIPRNEEDGFMKTLPGRPCSTEELDIILGKIKKEILKKSKTIDL